MDQQVEPELLGPPADQPALPWRRASSTVGRAFAAVLSLSVLAGTAYGWWTFGGIDDNTATTNVIDNGVADRTVPLDGAVDMLLVGLDSRKDAFGNPLPKDLLAQLHGGKDEGELNTDTMILVHIPVDGKHAVAISFPRDSWVDISGGFGKHKLNSALINAYVDARQTLVNKVSDPAQLDREAMATGRKNLIDTIENLIGHAVTIERYAEVNLYSFYEVTNAIGGVEVCLNHPVHETNSGADFPAGRQTISGAAALSFVRQRYGLPNGDLDRIVRQQVFLGALANKVLSTDMLTSPSKVRELITAVQKSVVLSNGWSLSRFAAQMSGLTSGNIEFYTIPTLGNAKVGDADVIKVDPREVHDFVASLTGDSSGTSNPAPTSTPGVPDKPAAKPSAIRVDVRNASAFTGLATTVQNSLASLGFGRGEVGDSSVERPTSTILYPPGELANATMVQQQLHGSFALSVDDSLRTGHVQVVLGTDYGNGLGLPSQTGATGSSSSPSTSSSTSDTPLTRIDAGQTTCVN